MHVREYARADRGHDSVLSKVCAELIPQGQGTSTGGAARHFAFHTMALDMA